MNFQQELSSYRSPTVMKISQPRYLPSLLSADPGPACRPSQERSSRRERSVCLLTSSRLSPPRFCCPRRCSHHSHPALTSWAPPPSSVETLPQRWHADVPVHCLLLHPAHTRPPPWGGILLSCPGRDSPCRTDPSASFCQADSLP